VRTLEQTKWAEAKKELKKLGLQVKTRVQSCELGCAGCVDTVDWSDTDAVIWQTSKRFSPKYGGYLNHQNITDELKWRIMATLNSAGIKWEWDGESHHTIFIQIED
jgi:hypothetical protein